VSKATAIEDFRMSSTRVMEAGGVALAKAFALGTSLRRLDLKDNSLGSMGGLALAHVLTAHPNLTHVVLSETGALAVLLSMPRCI
jgi:Ran GTPase-activating protein 1